jgi:hypothetical protein
VALPLRGFEPGHLIASPHVTGPVHSLTVQAVGPFAFGAMLDLWLALVFVPLALVLGLAYPPKRDAWA